VGGMKSSLPAPTRAENRRFYILKFEIGCLNHPGTPAEAHHLIDPKTGKRISHAATIPLCLICHHDIHSRKRWFRAEYGRDEFLLQITNMRVADFESRTVG